MSQDEIIAGTAYCILVGILVYGGAIWLYFG